MTNLRWLKWHITKHYHNQGLQVRLRSIKLGNTAIDSEVIGPGWRMAVEIKTQRRCYERVRPTGRGISLRVR